MAQKILFVSHCILNTAAKVVMFEENEMAAEEALRVKFLQKAISARVQLVQLPCPEFSLYGCQRWGHTSNQFDNPFFRSHCRKILKPVILQLKEYLSVPERFEVMGILGIDGSPSCGVDYSCVGNWGANLSGREDLAQCIASARLVTKQGIFMQELSAVLKENSIKMPLIGLFAPEPEKAMSLV